MPCSRGRGKRLLCRAVESVGAAFGSPPVETIGAAFGSPPVETIGAAFGSPPVETIGAAFGSPPVRGGERGDYLGGAGGRVARRAVNRPKAFSKNARKNGIA